MVRRNRDKSAAVSDSELELARQSAQVAADHLAELEQSDPSRPGWGADYGEAVTASRVSAQRVIILEAQLAAQVEQAGQRAAVAQAARPELDQIAKGLAASRDAIADAAAAHLASLARLATAVHEHNAALAQHRTRLAELGLAVGEGFEEGVCGTGIIAGGTSWTSVPAEGLVTHSLHEVFTATGPQHPFSLISRYRWRAFEVSARPDHLAVPTLASLGVTAPAPPPVLRGRAADPGPVLNADRIKAMEEPRS